MPRPGYRLRNKVRLFFAVVLVLTLLVGGGLFAYGYFFKSPDTANNPNSGDEYVGTINVLVLGVDARKGENMTRTDTIMLCTVDTNKNIMGVLSIPRDTRVYIPGHGYDKINSASVYGGPELSMQVVSSLLGVPVNNYVLTNYEGFKEIIDKLGGVTINVEKRMYHYDPQDGGAYNIDLQPGLQKLDGEKALQFVRFRSMPNGDIDRTGLQQQFIRALADQVLQPATVVKLPSLALSLSRAVETNLSMGDITKLARSARKMNSSNLVTQTLPGKFLNYDGISYWQVDPATAHYVVAGMYEGRTDNQVVQGEVTVASAGKTPSAGNGIGSGSVVPGTQKVDVGSESSSTNTNGETAGTDNKKDSAKNTGGSSGKTTVKNSKPKTGTPAGGIVPGVPDQAKDEPDVTIEITD
ncbi:MAG: LCP family protein [Bacillota bacterium]